MTVGSVESRTSWVVSIASLVVLSVSYGAPLTTVVALKPIAAEFGASRSAPALAVALTFIGAGCGGIAMGWIAERIGVRWVVISGGIMIGIGLTLSSLGGLTQLYISSFLFVGLLGAAGMFAPLMTYVSRWFDRRRGTAIALISAGQYVAGALWPALFEGRNGQIAAVALIAIAFGLAHLTLGLLPAAIAMILGFLLGIIMVVHQSIWPAVIAHGMFDATSFALVPVVMGHLHRAH